MSITSTGVSKASFSINEFCVRHALSRSKFYKLRRAGLGPKEMQLGGMVRISAMAEADWQRACEKIAQAKAEAAS